MGWLVFAVAFVIYAATAAPALSWLDAAEFATAAQALAVAHPPGHPIPSLLGRLLVDMPLGEAAFRVNLASSLAGAVAAAATFKAARTAAVRLVTARPAAVIGAAGALGFALSRAAWEQAARAEVYALQAALLAAALAWALAYVLDRDARDLYAATLATGLALANHHFVAVCFFAPVAAVVLAGRLRLAAAGRLAAIGILGLAAFLYLPLRAAHDILGWGDADRLSPFLWTVSAQAFQKSLAGPAPPFAQLLGDVATALADNLTLAAAALVLVGAYALARRSLAAAVLLAGVAACGAVGRVLVGFEPDNPDALGYLLPALAALFVLAAAGAAAVAGVDRRARWPVAAAMLLLPGVQVIRNAGAASYRDGEAADTFARAVVAAPADALVVTSYYETHFLAVAAQRLEGERPDVTVIDRNLLTQPYAPAAARRRHPELAALIDAPLVGGLPTPVAALATLRRPVALEPPMNLDAGDPVLPRLGMRGLLAALDAPPDPGDQEAFDALARRMKTPSAPDRHGAARILTWEAFLRARLFCLTGRRDAARVAAARVDPDDEMLRSLDACLAR